MNKSKNESKKVSADQNVRKYAMGGFVLPLRRECTKLGAGDGTNVVDANGRIVKHFNSITLADQFVKKQNGKGNSSTLGTDASLAPETRTHKHRYSASSGECVECGEQYASISWAKAIVDAAEQGKQITVIDASQEAAQ